MEPPGNVPWARLTGAHANREFSSSWHGTNDPWHRGVCGQIAHTSRRCGGNTGVLLSVRVIPLVSVGGRVRERYPHLIERLMAGVLALGAREYHTLVKIEAPNIHVAVDVAIPHRAVNGRSTEVSRPSIHARE